jgi:hypothetical protein
MLSDHIVKIPFKHYDFTFSTVGNTTVLRTIENWEMTLYDSVH